MNSWPLLNSVENTLATLYAGLWSPAAVLAFVKGHGSAASWDFVQKQQRRLKELIAEAKEWHTAEQALQAEKESCSQQLAGFSLLMLVGRWLQVTACDFALIAGDRLGSHCATGL